MAHNMNEVRMLDFSVIGDPRGYIVVAECMKEIPFCIQRIFFIFSGVKEILCAVIMQIKRHSLY